LLDAERVRICEHEAQNYVKLDSIKLDSITSLWDGSVDIWCKKCGYCMSDPTRDPRPEALRAEKEFNDAISYADGTISLDLSVEGLGCPVDPE
jgi:hypothetical protein